MNSSGKYRISHKNYKLLLPRVAHSDGRGVCSVFFVPAKIIQRGYNTRIGNNKKSRRHATLKIVPAVAAAISRKAEFRGG